MSKADTLDACKLLLTEQVVTFMLHMSQTTAHCGQSWYLQSMQHSLHKIRDCVHATQHSCYTPLKHAISFSHYKVILSAKPGKLAAHSSHTAHTQQEHLERLEQDSYCSKLMCQQELVMYIAGCWSAEPGGKPAAHSTHTAGTAGASQPGSPSAGRHFCRAAGLA